MLQKKDDEENVKILKSDKDIIQFESNSKLPKIINNAYKLFIWRSLKVQQQEEEQQKGDSPKDLLNLLKSSLEELFTLLSENPKENFIKIKDFFRNRYNLEQQLNQEIENWITLDDLKEYIIFCLLLCQKFENIGPRRQNLQLREGDVYHFIIFQESLNLYSYIVRNLLKDQEILKYNNQIEIQNSKQQNLSDEVHVKVNKQFQEDLNKTIKDLGNLQQIKKNYYTNTQCLNFNPDKDDQLSQRTFLQWDNFNYVKMFFHFVINENNDNPETKTVNPLQNNDIKDIEIQLKGNQQKDRKKDQYQEEISKQIKHRLNNGRKIQEENENQFDQFKEITSYFEIKKFLFLFLTGGAFSFYLYVLFLSGQYEADKERVYMKVLPIVSIIYLLVSLYTFQQFFFKSLKLIQPGKFDNELTVELFQTKFLEEMTNYQKRLYKDYEPILFLAPKSTFFRLFSCLNSQTFILDKYDPQINVKLSDDFKKQIKKQKKIKDILIVSTIEPDQFSNKCVKTEQRQLIKTQIEEHKEKSKYINFLGYTPELKLNYKIKNIQEIQYFISCNGCLQRLWIYFKILILALITILLGGYWIVYIFIYGFNRTIFQYTILRSFKLQNE